MKSFEPTRPAMTPSVLHSWKDIARFMGCGVRTAQRWEKLGLPVHRPYNKPRSPVLASTQELLAWAQRHGSQPQAPSNGDNHRGAQFVASLHTVQQYIQQQS
ncbi:MAG: hypothetical protein JOZ43_09520, partial [Acidobacteriales bacterium]|nr:hypothetical protein [Terriglobales bacterium]